MGIELFENRKEHYLVIKDGSSQLRLTEEQFKEMRKRGISPLLWKLWEAAKAERQNKAE